MRRMTVKALTSPTVRKVLSLLESTRVETG
jgi:hypothetical protein